MQKKWANFGNFHYGFVGAGAGISDGLLLWGAGWANWHDNPQDRPRYGSPFDPKNATHGDQPGDQAQIKQVSQPLEWVPLLMKMKKILLMIQIMVLCITLGCLPSSSNIVSARVASSENTATLSKRNSGAMSKGSTLVSVLANGVPDNSTDGLIVLGIIGDQPVEMKWIDPHNLALSCQQCTPQDVDFEVVKSGDITISYDKCPMMAGGPIQAVFWLEWGAARLSSSR
jgi:hypothetical protein